MPSSPPRPHPATGGRALRRRSPDRRGRTAARLGLAAGTASLLPVALAGPAAAGDDPRLASLREALADGRYQTSIPERVAGEASFSFWWSPLGLVIVGAGTLLALVLLAVIARERRRAREAAPASGRARPAPTPRAVSLAPARALANAGRFGDAVHALLLAVLDALRGPQRLRASETAREIRRRARLDPARHAALGVLVEAAERGHFAGRDLDADDYARCEDAARSLIAAPAGAEASG